MSEEDFEMKEEYDFSKGRPNPYAKRIRDYGSNLVVIEPELYRVFPSSEAVNEALRLLVKAGQSAIETASPTAPGQDHAKAS